MRDPVVASDGNSYERTAIQVVLQRGNALSPLTREVLRPELFPNRNLRKRIESYDGEVLDFATKAVETAVDRFVTAAGLGVATDEEISTRRSKRPVRAPSSNSDGDDGQRRRH